MKNQPGTIKTNPEGGYGWFRWLQETLRRKWSFFVTDRQTDRHFIIIYISSSPSSHHNFHFHLEGEACHDQKLGRSSWWIAVDKHTKATVRAPSMRFISPFKTHLHLHPLNPPFVIIAFWWFLSGFQFGLGESQIFLHVVCYPTKGRK